jgi:hypothetical protein
LFAPFEFKNDRLPRQAPDKPRKRCLEKEAPFSAGVYLGHTMPDLEASASRGIIMRNQISHGMDCYQIDASSNVIFEENHCIGINLFSRGSAAGSTYGGPAATGVFFARNSERYVFGGDQEELTTDAGWTNYLGCGKRLLCVYNFVHMKTINLPRQARDKHRKT